MRTADGCMLGCDNKRENGINVMETDWSVVVINVGGKVEFTGEEL